MKIKSLNTIIYLLIAASISIIVLPLSLYADSVAYEEIAENKIPISIEIIDKTGKSIYSHLRQMILNNIKLELNNAEYNIDNKERAALFTLYVQDLKKSKLEQNYIIGAIAQPIQYETVFLKNPFFFGITSDKNTAQTYITVIVVYTVEEGKLLLDVTKKNISYNVEETKEFSFFLNDFTLFDDLKLLCSTKIKSFITRYLFVSLSVASNEVAYVEVNGTIVGKTNNDYSIRAGQAKIRVFKNGYDDYVSNSEIEKDTKITANLSLALKQYTVKIDSYPMNTDIYINGDYIGKSPVIYKTVKGLHTITAMANGYEPITQTIALDTVKEVAVTLVLPVTGYSQYYKSYADSYLESGYTKAFVGGLFVAGAILTYLVGDYMLMEYVRTNDKNTYNLFISSQIVTFIFYGGAFLDLLGSLSDFYYYDMIMRNYLR